MEYFFPLCVSLNIRFYDKRLFLQEDIGHYKLKCEG